MRTHTHNVLKQAVICIFQAIYTFFYEYLIISAQRGKNRSGD